MEHEIYLSGVGGQGIQLAAKTLALAAMRGRRQVMLNAFYGFEMRGFRAATNTSSSMRSVCYMKKSLLQICIK